tara:strand:+ start:123 stop:443 length:321 start_codon:yes stop_codon:yes gene_type:complete
MNEALGLMLAVAAGGLLGAMYFGGLWWTVRKGLSSQQPAIWFSGSLLLRTITVLAGFYWVGQYSWTRLLACLLGFVIARVVVTWFTRVPETTVSAAEEAHHATQPR